MAKRKFRPPRPPSTLKVAVNELTSENTNVATLPRWSSVRGNGAEGLSAFVPGVELVADQQLPS